MHPGAGDPTKPFLPVGGQRVIDWSLQAAGAVSAGIVIVVPERMSQNPNLFATFDTGPPPRVVPGGATRSESVRRGLLAVPEQTRIIVVHDAARPLASVELFEMTIEAIVAGADAAMPTIPILDTVQHIDGSPADRSKLEAVQTPQAFDASSLRSAHAGDAQATDDVTLVAMLGGRVTTVSGNRWNLKLTQPGDLEVIAALLALSTKI